MEGLLLYLSEAPSVVVHGRYGPIMLHVVLLDVRPNSVQKRDSVRVEVPRWGTYAQQHALFVRHTRSSSRRDSAKRFKTPDEALWNLDDMNLLCPCPDELGLISVDDVVVVPVTSTSTRSSSDLE